MSDRTAHIFVKWDDGEGNPCWKGETHHYTRRVPSLFGWTRRIDLLPHWALTRDIYEALDRHAAPDQQVATVLLVIGEDARSQDFQRESGWTVQSGEEAGGVGEPTPKEEQQ